MSFEKRLERNDRRRMAKLHYFGGGGGGGGEVASLAARMTLLASQCRGVTIHISFDQRLDGEMNVLSVSP